MVLGVDGSTGARAAEQYVARLCRPAEDEITVVHVLKRLPPNLSAVLRASGLDPGEMKSERRQRAAALLEASVARLAEHGFRMNQCLETGRPGPILCEVAEQRDADLLVLGRRGQSVLEELVVGSVSRDVVHHSPIPVALVPTPGEG